MSLKEGDDATLDFRKTNRSSYVQGIVAWSVKCSVIYEPEKINCVSVHKYHF